MIAALAFEPHDLDVVALGLGEGGRQAAFAGSGMIVLGLGIGGHTV